MASFNLTDLEYILTQILMAETGQPPVNPHLAFGLREVAGTSNSAVPGQETLGSVDQLFPRFGVAVFQQAEERPLVIDSNGDIVQPFNGGQTSYLQTTGTVYDSQPRIISNLIVDQTENNPAALEAQVAALDALGTGYQSANNIATPPALDANGNLFIPNVTPDAGLSAPFNTWFTLFGQFFDHGLDLVNKGGNGTVRMLLAYDDPLYNKGVDNIAGTEDDLGADMVQGTFDDPFANFMSLTRATQTANHEATNAVTPFVDQNQTYTSHPSHQVFLREYVTGIDGVIHSTGGLLSGVDGHGMATWADVKANALKLGILLTDEDVGRVPLVKVDAYGNFIPDPTTGMAQLIVSLGGDGVAGSADDVTISGTPGTPVAASLAVGAGIQFINDMAHTADPHDARTGLPLAKDDDDIAGPVPNPDFVDTLPEGPSNLKFLPQTPGTYDDELLDKHFVAGDGRANENIGLTAVHEIFHSEHNRLLEETKDMIRAELANGNVSFVQNWVLAGADLTDGIIGDDEWNGERLFQVAKFGTETQYQHLVFEEFARKVAPTIHLFGNVDIHLDPAINAEFAHAVYRFGHSMLDENVNRYVMNEAYLDVNGDHTAFKFTAADGTLTNDAQSLDPDTNVLVDNTLNASNPLVGTPVMDLNGQPILNEIGLIEAFTNPLAYAAQGENAAGEIILGSVNQVGNEIDEFVTGALRNNLLGLPLDLAALNIARGRDTGVPPLNELRNQIYTQTGDATLKPYESWVDFGTYLKHAASLINFVAAYGTHDLIASAVTLQDKRGFATAIVTGQDFVYLGIDGVVGGDDDIIYQAPADAYDFMNSQGAYANDIGDPRALQAQWSTGSVTGLDRVDLWIGGLAEKQNLFGGLLGSTFNFVFETQLENLQDADRLYYLPRIEGLHWGTEIEANSFAEMMIRNTGVKHISASVFLTPEYVIEASNIFVRDAAGNILTDVDGNFVTTDPATWAHNAASGAPLVTILNDGTIKFLGDDNFFGNTMVIGGTEFADKLEAGHADDDTVWGDGGNDELDGGGGNDFIYGGTGDDFIHDIAGDDVIHGDQGNDKVQAGIGDDIVFGGDGDDLLDGGLGIDAINGGLGNDIILGGEDDDELVGDEGDDWIEGNAGGDLMVGDHGAPTGQIPLIQGNDVLDGGANGDRMQGFSGDDITLGEGGFDRFEGGLGFDWASYEHETHGVEVDMTRKLFIPDPAAPAGDAVRDIFPETEAVSGTRFGDILKGDDLALVDPFNELNNKGLIDGITNYFDPMAGEVPFSGGNIMFGAGGSDFIMGGGGNDIIDGDARLHVELVQGHTAGSQIIREVLYDQVERPVFDALGATSAGDIDTAVFNFNFDEYQIVAAFDANGDPRFGTDGAPVWQVTHVGPQPGGGGGGGGGVALGGVDGVDLLFNMERAQFADTTIDLTQFNPFGQTADFVPNGTLTMTLNGTVVDAVTVVNVGDTLTITQALDPNTGLPLFAASDAVDLDPTPLSQIDDFEGVLVNGVLDAATQGFARENIPIDELSLQWQALDVARPVWVNIAGATGLSFTPTNAQLGTQVRLVATFTDGLGVHEKVISAPTAILTANPDPAANLAPTLVQQGQQPGLSDTAGIVNSPLGTAALPGIPIAVLVAFTDDTTPANQLVYSATLANGQPLESIGLTFTPLFDAAGNVIDARLFGTPTTVGPISIRVTATDAGTPALSVQDTFILNVLPRTNTDGVVSIAADLDLGAVVGTSLTAVVTDLDSLVVSNSALHYQWYRDGVSQFGQSGSTYQLTDADLNSVITVRAQYVDGRGHFEVHTSAPTDPIAPGANQPPQVTAIDASYSEDQPFSQDLITGFATDPDATDVLSVVNADTPISTTGGRALTSADFTIDANGVFSLTATGIAAFNDLKEGEPDSFVLNFEVTDGTNPPVPNTLTVNVTGVNDDPIAPALANVPVTEGATASVDLLAGATDPDNDALTASVVGAAPAGVSLVGSTLSIDANDPAYNALAQGAHQLVTVNYSVSDGIASVPQSVTFDVTGANDPLTDIAFNAVQPASGTAAPAVNATLANLLAVDPDIGDTASFQLLAGSTTGFALSPAGVLTRSGAVLASNSVATLNVRATDGGGATFDETINVRVGTTGNDAAITGGANTDIVYALGGNDTVNGNNGDDTLFGQDGTDALNGGAGNDTLYGGANGGILGLGIENLNGGTGNDAMNGGAGPDNFIVDAAFGNDIITGFDATTGVVLGLVLQDRIAVGNIGITAANFATRVTIGADGTGGTLLTLRDGATNTVQGTIDLVGVNAANISATDFNFTPTGMSLSDYKVSENAAGAIIGDVVIHDDSGDTHTFVVSDNRFEVVDASPADGEQLVLKLKDGISLDYEAANTINLDVSVFDSANQGSLLNPYSFAIEVQNVNEQVGGSGNDLLNGTSGDDLLNGGAGRDQMNGGLGNDTYVVDNNGDRIFDTGGIDTVETSLSSYTLASNLENLIATGAGNFRGTGNALNNGINGSNGNNTLNGLGGSDVLTGFDGNDNLYGGAGSDELYGGRGRDNLDGGSSNDIINGGEGNDIATGGSGQDTFSFGAGFGNDRITDFDAIAAGGQDLIDLRALGITAADFAARVQIEDIGAHTLITVDGTNHIQLDGIRNATTVAIDDFLVG